MTETKLLTTESKHSKFVNKQTNRNMLNFGFFVRDDRKLIISSYQRDVKCSMRNFRQIEVSETNFTSFPQRV